MIKPVFTLFFRVSVAAAEKVYCCSSVTTRQWNSTQCCWAAAERWGREEVSSGAFTRPWTRSCGRKLYKNCSLERNLAVLLRVYTNTQTHTPSSSLYRSLENSKARFKCLCVCVCAVYVVRVHAWTVRCWVCSHKAAVIGFERRGLQSASQPIPVLASGEPDFSRKGKQNTQSRTQPSLPPTRFLFSTHTHHQLQD